MTAPLPTVQDYANRILKVNHAGENGAVNIYRGQILAARLTVRDLLDELKEFKSHEERHRSIFWAELVRREHPRCKSYLLCGVGGLLLGLFTGLLGRRAIAASTVAVERVVLTHLESQHISLRDVDPTAYAAVSAIISDERLHRDQSAAYVNADQVWFRLLSPIVAGSTEAVIWFGMRL